MSTRYKFSEQYAGYFVTFAVVDWADVFTRTEYRNMVVDSLNYCINNKGLLVHGWVLMTNHLHLLISIDQKNSNSLSDILRDMKKFTAMQLIKAIKENNRESRREWMMYLFERAGKYNSNNKNFQFWQQDNHPLLLKNDDAFAKALTYIHENPVNAGLVENSIAYPWSSAADYAGKKGRVQVALM